MKSARGPVRVSSWLANGNRVKEKVHPEPEDAGGVPRAGGEP